MGLVIDHLFQLPFPIQNMNECFSQMFTKRKDNCTIKNSMIFLLLFFFLWGLFVLVLCVHRSEYIQLSGSKTVWDDAWSAMYFCCPVVFQVRWEELQQKRHTHVNRHRPGPRAWCGPWSGFFFFFDLCGSLCLLVSPVFLVETDLGASLQSSAPQQ